MTAHPLGQGRGGPDQAGAAGPDRLVDGLRAVGCVFAEDEAELIRRHRGPGDHPDVVAARFAGTPLEHVLGVVEFCGLQLEIGPGVFVPRVRAELLAKVAAAHPAAADAVLVDLGTGCGAIAALLACRAPARVIGCELDPVAADFARRNGSRFGFEVREGSWWRALPAELDGRVTLAVGYLPHVPTAALDFLPRDLRCAEPAITVDGGLDGLDPLRQVWAGAAARLAPGATLLTLIGAGQLEAAGRIAPVRVLAQEDADLVVALG